MIEQKKVQGDEVDLFGVIDFLLAGWRTIVLMTVVGVIAGLGAALLLPEKFQASVSIAGAKVLGKDVEPIEVLAERMLSPSFYSDKTLALCQDTESPDPAQSVARMLGPNVLRNAPMVSVSAKMANKESAQSCLNGVLEDVRSSQNASFQLLSSSSKKELDQLKLDLAKSERKLQEESKLFESELADYQNNLAEAQSFVRKFSSHTELPGVTDQNFSASTLLASLVSEKQKEILDLGQRILGLKARISVKEGTPETEKIASDLRFKILDLEGLLQAPSTQEAVFSTPIFSPKTKAEPRRTLILIGGLLIGAFAGLLLLLLRRFAADFRKRRQI